MSAFLVFATAPPRIAYTPPQPDKMAETAALRSARLEADASFPASRPRPCASTKALSSAPRTQSPALKLAFRNTVPAPDAVRTFRPAPGCMIANIFDAQAQVAQLTSGVALQKAARGKLLVSAPSSALSTDSNKPLKRQALNRQVRCAADTFALGKFADMQTLPVR
jgi:hypothetical protein